MRKWIIKVLNGVPQRDFEELYSLYRQQNMMIQETIERHQMQGAWAQTKLAHKNRRLH